MKEEIILKLDSARNIQVKIDVKKGNQKSK